MQDSCPPAGLGLALNAGSATLKFALFELPAQSAPRCLGRGSFAADARADGARECWQRLQQWLAQDGRGAAVQCIAHRIVHGGQHLQQPLPGNALALAEVERLAALAPLHQGLALAIARLSADAFPGARQLLCFDTAFHRTQPQLARLYGLPLRFYDAGIQRYGFHGLSCEYIAGRLRELAPLQAAGRVVVAHLGGGASLTALADGRSIASTMGLTPLDGLPMGTRSGGLDPGAVLYLQQQMGLDPAAVGELLNHGSGLLGLSGVSADVRVLEASAEPAAALALQYFAYRVNRELGSLVAALGGLDALVFTGGIGAHSAGIRAAVGAHAAWTGLRLDASANAVGRAQVSAADSRVCAWVLETDEELVMARALQRHAASIATTGVGATGNTSAPAG